MDPKSPLFSDRACMILDEIFEEIQENSEIIFFSPPDEMGAEPMEISSQPHTQNQSQQSEPIGNEVVEESCDNAEGSEAEAEEEEEQESEQYSDDITPPRYNEEDIVVMAPVVSFRYPRCEGCMNYEYGFAPDQFSHMGPGGCLADPEEDDNDIQ
jgi:hypothetical protein